MNSYEDESQTGMDSGGSEHYNSSPFSVLDEDINVDNFSLCFSTSICFYLCIFCSISVIQYFVVFV